MGLSKKIMNNLQIDKGCKFALECDWICKIPQNVLNLIFLSKHRWYFRKNFLTFWKIARASKVAEEWDWKSKKSQNVQS